MVANPAHTRAPYPDRESELRRAESEAEAVESALAGDVANLVAAFADVSGRLQALKAGLARAQLATRDPAVADLAQQIGRAKPPAFDPAQPLGDVLAARANAVQLRLEASDRVRTHLHASSIELSRWTGELARASEVIRGSESRAAEQRQRDQEAAVESARAAEQFQRAAEESARAALAHQAATPGPAVPSLQAPAPRLDGRRKTPRVAMQAAVDLHSDTNFFAGFSTDLSSGGLFVATVQYAPIGTEIDLSFVLPSGERVSAHGVVRWTREVNDKTPHIFPGIGVQFVGLPDEAKKIIEKFVSEREPMFYPD